MSLKKILAKNPLNIPLKLHILQKLEFLVPKV